MISRHMSGDGVRMRIQAPSGVRGGMDTASSGQSFACACVSRSFACAGVSSSELELDSLEEELAESYSAQQRPLCATEPSSVDGSTAVGADAWLAVALPPLSWPLASANVVALSGVQERPASVTGTAPAPLDARDAPPDVPAGAERPPRLKRISMARGMVPIDYPGAARGESVDDERGRVPSVAKAPHEHGTARSRK